MSENLIVFIFCVIMTFSIRYEVISVAKTLNNIEEHLSIIKNRGRND